MDKRQKKQSLAVCLLGEKCVKDAMKKFISNNDKVSGDLPGGDGKILSVKKRQGKKK